jgi:hypothetical protein
MINYQLTAKLPLFLKVIDPSKRPVYVHRTCQPARPVESDAQLEEIAL